MAYVINKFDGTPLVVLEDGTLNTTTSLGLVGRNYIGYGEIQNENFLHLLENFANNAPPPTPIAGQTWYDTTTDSLSIYTGVTWIPVGGATISAVEPTAVSGSLWYNTSSDQLFLYNVDKWDLIGPEAVAGFGKTRLVSETIIDSAAISRPVIKVVIDDLVIAIISKDSFTIGPTNLIPNFFNIRSGITLASNQSMTGAVFGNSTTATTLENERTINGIIFDGSKDVEITAATDNFLKAGDYLLGNDFNGKIETTWKVDASPLNLSGKVVARDSSGNFSAGTITASLSGNAFSASRLQVGRAINGVNFDGTTNITINAATPRILVRGEYLTGSSFNGSVETTWSVDASIESLPFKVVVRDQFGDFEAGTVTATLNGNASTATTLQNFININGTPFNGSDDLLTSKWGIGRTISIGGTSKLVNGSENVTWLTSEIAAQTANQLATARAINGTSFNGSTNITTANWGTARNISIGGTTKSVNGSENVTWSLAEIGAFPASSLPAGTTMLFAQTAAPTGWTKVTTHNDKALRVVSGTAGSGGSVNFTTAFQSKSVVGSVGNTILTTAQLPAHTHNVTGSGTTGNNNRGHVHNFSTLTNTAGNHAHSGSTNAAGIHHHVYPGDDQLAAANGRAGWQAISDGPFPYDARSVLSGGAQMWRTSSAGNHSHSFTTAAAGEHSHSVSGGTGGENQNHTHNFTFSGNSTSTGSSQPHTHTFTGTSINLNVQYVDVILATKN